MALTLTKEQLDQLLAEFNDIIATNKGQNEANTKLATATEGHTQTLVKANEMLATTKANLETERTIFLAEQANALENAEKAAATAIAEAEDILNKAKMAAQVASNLHDSEMNFFKAKLEGRDDVADPTPPAQIVDPPAPAPIVIPDPVPVEPAPVA